MFGEAADEQTAIKAFVDGIVEEHHDVAHLILQTQVDDSEIVVGIHHVEVFDHLFISDVPLTEAGSLVEYRECVSHSTVGFFRDDSQCLLLIADTFLLSHIFQVLYRALYRHTFKVVDLTA